MQQVTRFNTYTPNNKCIKSSKSLGQTRSPQTNRYIESSKSRASGTPEAEQSLAVAAYVFDRVLKLMHPFMPYVTEELWQALPHAGGRTCAAVPKLCGSVIT